MKFIAGDLSEEDAFQANGSHDPSREAVELLVKSR